MNWLLDRSERRGPFAAVGFSSLHYPHTHLSRYGAAGEALQRAAQEVAARHGLQLRHYFAGISDLSFIGSVPDAETLQLLQEEHAAPTAAFLDTVSEGLQFPAVNLGPWGHDYHQWLERVHLPYALQGLPAAVYDLVNLLLSEQ